MNSLTTTSRSSVDSSSDRRSSTTMASCAGDSAVCSRCGLWLRSAVVSRYFHLRTVDRETLYRSASARSGRSEDRISSRSCGVVRACLWMVVPLK